MNDNLKKGNKATQFTSSNQPNGLAKSKGKSQKRLIKDIASQILSGNMVKAEKSLASYLGLDIKNIDLETLMHLKQFEKAIKDSDTRAYIPIMDRLKGKPKQEVDSKPLKEFKPTTITFVHSNKNDNKTT